MLKNSTPISPGSVAIKAPQNEGSFLGSGLMWFLSVLGAVLVLLSQYPLLMLYGIAVMIVITRFFWQIHQPAVILFWFLYQWIQVMGAIWYVDNLGLTFSRAYWSQNAEIAVILAFTGILLQACFLKLIIYKKRKFSLADLKEAAGKLNINRIIYVYLIAAILFPFVYRFAINLSALTQVILLFMKIKQITTVLLVFILFLRKEKKTLILLVLLVEFLSGFLTYFSTFKDVIIITLICYCSFVRTIKLTTAIKILPLISLLVVLMVFWTAVKGRYRMYVNEGTRTQQVQVGADDAFKKLFELVTTFNGASFQMGVNSLAYRIQYTYFLTKTMDRVPAVIPHEEGALLIDALRFILVPRFFDPDKGLHDASVKTSKYTGLRIAGLSRGTSMAIGYFGDSYIDFGPVWMMIPVIIIAMLVGLYYKFLMSIKVNTILVYSIVTGFIMSIGFFESDIVIILGNLKNGFIVNLILAPTLYKWLNKYITSYPRNSRKLKSAQWNTV